MTTSALPKAVQKQVKAANEILEYMKNPPADPPQDPPAGEGDDGWRHKYNVLQGKYNAEVPRLQRELGGAQDLIQEMRQRQNNLETTLASMQATRESPADPPAAPPPAVTPDEIETFGPDLHDFIQRTAQDIANKLVADKMKGVEGRVDKVASDTSQVSKTVAHSKQQEVIRQLEAAVPTWAELNNDKEGFIPWLDQDDPYAGQKRGVLLRQAFANFDASRVIAIFKGYLNENAAVTSEPSTPTPPADPPSDPPAEPQTTMESLVAPGAPNAPTASAPDVAGKRVWTQKEVSQLYQRKNEFIRRNPGKAMPEELQKLERDLFKAQSENRLRG